MVLKVESAYFLIQRHHLNNGANVVSDNTHFSESLIWRIMTNKIPHRFDAIDRVFETFSLDYDS